MTSRRRRPPGARRAGLAAACAAGLLAAQAPAAPIPLVHPAGAGETETLLGFAVTADGGYVAAAAPHRTVGDHPQAGAVHLFTARDGRLVRTLHAPDPSSGANFGYALALDGRHVLVGAPRAAPAGATMAGAAYLFDRDTGALLREWRETPPVPHHELGLTVALDRGRAVVGVPGATAGGVPHAGLAFVFSVETGALLHRLGARRPRAGEGFAHAVALAGRLLAIGAPLAAAGDVAGAGRVDVFDARTGTRLRALHGAPAVAGARFGFALALAGPRALVGAPGSHEPSGPAGRAHLRDARSGAQLHLLAPPAAPPDRPLFGYAVALDGATALVGAPDATPAARAKAGAAYAFDAATGALRAAWREPTPTALSQFGVAVALDRGAAAVGAQRARLAPGGGAVYLHRD